MTVSSENFRWIYTGDGTTTVFAYNNKIFATNQLNVYLDGTLQTETTHYTVSGAGDVNGGNVTFVTAPGSSVKVLILRNMDLLQGTDYPVGGAFPAAATEDALDELTMIDQQQQEEIDRSLKQDLDRTFYEANSLRITGGSAAINGTDFTLLNDVNTLIAAATLSSANLNSVPIDVANIAGLRTVDSSSLTDGAVRFVRAYATDGDGGGGFYYLDKDDTSSSDDGGAVIVDASSGRWKIIITNGRVNVKRFGANPNNISADDLTAFNNAISYSLNVFVPDGENYYLSAPITSVQGMSLSGEAEIQSDLERGAKIYAPEGFLNNSTGDRHRVSIRNIYAYGDGKATSGKIGINGQYGGLFQGNYLDKYDVLVQNNFSFLSDFIDNIFGEANKGLYLSTSNEVNILRNTFLSSCDEKIDTYNLTPGSGGAVSSYPININYNNFNYNISTESMKLVAGQVNMIGNYFECFGVPVDDHLVEFICRRFTNPTLVVEGNHCNAQSDIDHGFWLYSDNASGTTVKGRIQNNYLRGFNAEPIEIGGKGGSFFDRVEDIIIDNNSVASFPYVKYPTNAYYNPLQIWSASYTAATLDVSGASFVTIPYTIISEFESIDITSGVWNVSVAGLYSITAIITASFTSDIRNYEFRIEKNGSSIISSLNSLAVAVAGTNYQEGTLHITTYLSAGDDIEITARNGDLIFSSYLTVVKVGPQQVYTN